MGDLPLTFRVRQTFPAPQVDDPAKTVDDQLARLGLDRTIAAGQSVAVAVGSRGIANLATIVAAAIASLKRLGAEPFIVPAMGSHGGGTADGQRQVLQSYGVTEQACGCPIRAGMETEIVCQAAEGFPVHFDRQAYRADHVLVINRVKPHTRFVGKLESGLMKMLLIGLGKRNGAEVYHRAIHDFTFEQIVRSVAREVLRSCRIVGGLAIVENAREQTALIEAVPPEQFESREPELLEMARANLPRLPFSPIDLLVVDRIGKNISGIGLDTNIIGRKHNDRTAVDGEYPQVRNIYVRSLTPQTHGNATGIGLAEYCHRRVVEQIDPQATAVNCITAGHVSAAMVPVVFDTDREAIAAALSTIGLTEPPDARLIWIRDTLELIELECSAAFFDEARSRDDLKILTDPRPLPFDGEGQLPLPGE